MDSILTPSFLSRLQILRNNLAGSLGDLEIIRSNPEGEIDIPEPESHYPYTPGDDLRFIDWNLYARLDQFFVKSMLREEEGTFNILVDVSGSMLNPHQEKFQRCLEVAAAFSFLALCAGDTVALYAFSDRLISAPEAFRGEKRAFDLFRTLVNLPRGGPTDIGSSLQTISLKTEVNGSWALIISDLISHQSYEKYLDHFPLKGTRIGALQIICPSELSIRKRGSVILRDPETGRIIRRRLGHRSLKGINLSIDEYFRKTKKLFRVKGIKFQQSSCLQPFEKIVLDYLKSRDGGLK